jgi:uncharacterized spore protein YtfJ
MGEHSSKTEHGGVGHGVISAVARTMEINTSRQVFGDPITSGDITVIPVARVRGGGGGGGGGGRDFGQDGSDPGQASSGEGSGGGVSLSARPVGAFVVRGSEVTWRPAVDVNRIILGGQVVAIFALMVVRAFSKGRRRRRR